MALPQTLGGAPGGAGTVGQPGPGGTGLAGRFGGMPSPGGGITGARSLRRMARAITSNRKATAGAVLLLIFIVIMVVVKPF